jgi:hypothetical protein
VKSAFVKGFWIRPKRYARSVHDGGNLAHLVRSQAATHVPLCAEPSPAQQSRLSLAPRSESSRDGLGSPRPKRQMDQAERPDRDHAAPARRRSFSWEQQTVELIDCRNARVGGFLRPAQGPDRPVRGSRGRGPIRDLLYEAGIGPPGGRKRLRDASVRDGEGCGTFDPCRLRR